MGAQSLTDAELLAIIISSGNPGLSAEEIGEEIVRCFGSFRGIARQSLETLMEIKGLKKVKAIRIAAALEMGRRIVEDVVEKKRADELGFKIQEPLGEYGSTEGKMSF